MKMYEDVGAWVCEVGVCGVCGVMCGVGYVGADCSQNPEVPIGFHLEGVQVGGLRLVQSCWLLNHFLWLWMGVI